MSTFLARQTRYLGYTRYLVPGVPGTRYNTSSSYWKFIHQVWCARNSPLYSITLVSCVLTFVFVLFFVFRVTQYPNYQHSARLCSLTWYTIPRVACEYTGLLRMYVWIRGVPGTQRNVTKTIKCFCLCFFFFWCLHINPFFLPCNHQQYTQCPYWFFILRESNYVPPDWTREKPHKIMAN